MGIRSRELFEQFLRSEILPNCRNPSPGSVPENYFGIDTGLHSVDAIRRQFQNSIFFLSTIANCSSRQKTDLTPSFPTQSSELFTHTNKVFPTVGVAMAVRKSFPTITVLNCLYESSLIILHSSPI